MASGGVWPSRFPFLGPRSGFGSSCSSRWPLRQSWWCGLRGGFCRVPWRLRIGGGASCLCGVRRSVLWVDGLGVVGDDGQHQGLEILVLDFVLEDINFASAEEFGARFVQGLGDEELKGEGSSVVGLGLFLGAFALSHGERRHPHLELGAVGEFHHFFGGLQVGRLTQAVDCTNGNRHGKCCCVLLL